MIYNKKEEGNMTDTIVNNIKYFMEAEEIKPNYQTPKIDKIFNFLKVKSISKQAKSEINNYIEKNNDVRNGKAVIKGTRITTKEVLLIMSECPEEKDIFEYICEQYPSIESKEQVIYAIMYEINKINTINFILKVVMNS
ncbi:MAG: DUF433 domain-containing protein [Clostridia bacterium]|nr:DUF433 domain-containing protein [Clostridia bacterium]